MTERLRSSRIAIDADSPSELKILSIYFNTISLFPRVFIRRTGHGVHLRAYVTLTAKQNLQVRQLLGDDIGRLRFDEQRIRYTSVQDWIDTVFSIKKKAGQKLTREEPYNVLSKPFNSKLPARKIINHHKQNRYWRCRKKNAN